MTDDQRRPLDYASPANGESHWRPLIAIAITILVLLLGLGLVFLLFLSLVAPIPFQ